MGLFQFFGIMFVIYIGLKTVMYVFRKNSPGTRYRNPELTYRKNGDVDFDPHSRKKGFVEYNNAREAIRQARERGENCVKFSTCIATEAELTKDGYTFGYNENGRYITWK